MKNLEIIQRYHRGEMSEEEKAAFLQRCKTDSVLAEEVKLYFVSVQHRKKERIVQMHQNYLKTKRKKQIVFYFLVFIILIVLGYFVFDYFQQSNEPRELGDAFINTPSSKTTPVNKGDKDTLAQVIPEIVGDTISKEDSETIIPPPTNPPKTPKVVKKKPIASLIPKDEVLLDSAIKIGVIGAGDWKGELQNRNFDKAYQTLSPQYKNKEDLSLVEDNALYYGGILELYYKNNNKEALRLFEAIYENKNFIAASKLHIFLALYKDDRHLEALAFYNLHRETINDDLKKYQDFDFQHLFDELKK